MKFHSFNKSKNMRVFSIVLFALVLVSCVRSNKKLDLKELGELKELKVADSLSLFLGLPTTIKLFDNKLFIIDLFDEKESVKIYDLGKNKILFSFAKKGEGPYEYLHVSDVDVYKDLKGRIKINIYDPVSSKLGIYDYDSLMVMNSSYIPMIISSSNKDVQFHEMFKINGGYLATGLTIKGKYTLLSDSLKIVGYFGKYRPKPMEGIPDMSHLIANYGKSVLSDNRETLIEIIYNASVLSCYDIKHKEITKRWESVIHELDYRMDGEMIINNAVMGYLSACICNNKIYALYSGEPDNLNTVATYGKEIHVYDYEGHIINRYSISRPSFALCVDEKMKKIYVLSHIPEPNIIIYDIS